MRSCGPEWRWIFMRIAAVGTLNSVAPTLTGSRAGAAGAVRAPGRPQQIGDERDRARRDRAAQQDRNQVAAAVVRANPRAMCWAVEKNVMNEACVQEGGRAESPANMPCATRISARFRGDRAVPRAMSGTRFRPRPLTFP